MKFLFFILFISSSVLSAQDHSFKRIKRHLEPGGIEYIFETSDFGPHSHYSPDHPCLDCTLKVTKLKKAEQVYSLTYRLDRWGFRETEGMKRPGKQKHFLLIDGSVAFGEGLRDSETILDQINNRSKIYRAYDIGFLGQGPQHNWLTFSGGVLKEKVSEKSGDALLITHDYDLQRLNGAIDHIGYAAHFPHLIETSPGEFQHAGTFADSGTLLQKILIKACAPYLFCRNYMTRFHADPSDEDIARAARLIESMRKFHRQQFQSGTFTILWTGSDPVYEMLKKHTDIPVVKFRGEVGEDRHPTVRGAKQIADFLFEKKIVY